jgi:hypothetical protein
MTVPTADVPADVPADVTPAATIAAVGPLRRLIESEPVRLYLYGVLVVALAVLVSYGALTADRAALWGSLAGAVLAVPVTEGLRSQVTSPRTAARLAAGVRA